MYLQLIVGAQLRVSSNYDLHLQRSRLVSLISIHLYVSTHQIWCWGINMDSKDHLPASNGSLKAMNRTNKDGYIHSTLQHKMWTGYELMESVRHQLVQLIPYSGNTAS